MKQKKSFDLKKNIHIILIILFLIVVAAVASQRILTGTVSDTPICFRNEDCGWRPTTIINGRLTNCCDENAGATWKCVNLRNFSLECPYVVLCPQVISPKPTTDCLCELGSCVVK